MQKFKLMEVYMWIAEPKINDKSVMNQSKLFYGALNNGVTYWLTSSYLQVHVQRL